MKHSQHTELIHNPMAIPWHHLCKEENPPITEAALPGKSLYHRAYRSDAAVLRHGSMARSQLHEHAGQNYGDHLHRRRRTCLHRIYLH